MRFTAYAVGSLTDGSRDAAARRTCCRPGPQTAEDQMDRARLCVSELIGTFVLVFVGVGAVYGSVIVTKASDLLAIAAAFGIAVAVVVAATGHISGAHINPAVTLGLLVARKVGPLDAVMYWVSQLLGAVLAAAACDALLGEGAAVAGATKLAPKVTVVQGVVIEAVLTFILVLVIFGTAVDMRAQKLPALFIGATVTADILVGGPFTQASMNPARSFGPALVGSMLDRGVWEHHWVYWVGPLIGGALAGLLYTTVFLPRTAAEALPEVRPDAPADIPPSERTGGRR
jgi:MIP family channel proteins